MHRLGGGNTMKISKTGIPEVLVLTPNVYRDNRGAFCETWNQKSFADFGLPQDWVQDNCSVSARNVIRGIHYQIEHPQAKLVRAAYGAVLDVAVDLRRPSKTFGQFVCTELSDRNGQMLFIPAGFGHGFLALSELAVLAYKVTDYYCPAGERTILWNEPEIAIPWPIGAEDAILSEKDRKGLPLRDAEVFQ